MNTLLMEDLGAVVVTKGCDCLDIDEKLELIDMGDVVRETKQIAQYPMYADWMFGVGARDW